MEVLLHIGRHSTGTTALQQFLALNAELLLREAGILYPMAGRDTIKHYHHLVFRDVLDKKRHIDPQLLATIFAEARNSNARKILLSSETLSRPGFTESKIKLVKESFDGNDLRMIIYLRRQDDFLQSRYAAMVRRGDLTAPMTIHDIRPSLDYYNFLGRYEKVLGIDAMTVRIYDDAVRTNLFDDFLGVLGVRDTRKFVVPGAWTNRRLPWRYVALLRLANRHRWQRKIVGHRRMQQLARWLSNHFPDFMDAPKPLGLAERSALLERYESRNAKVAKRYLQRERLFVVE
jgi:hypothetical protein